VISGSYFPGDIYFFRGLGSGRYAKGTKLRSVDGKPANVGAASAVSVVDWDRDGDLDLVVGNIDGEVVWMANEGNRDGGPVFAKPPRWIVDISGGDTGPFVVDWDGDGKEDLLLGSGSGEVWLAPDMRNAKGIELKRTKPLVPALPTDSANTQPAVLRDEASGTYVPDIDRPQMRAKPSACDWNGDGLLDLLVGDFSVVSGPEPKLSSEEKVEKGRLEVKHSSISTRLSFLAGQFLERARYENGVRNHRKTEDEALEEKIAARTQELKQADAEYQRLYASLEPLVTRSKELSVQYYRHGYVWVYLRKPKAETR
jgi:hypothetical protein